MVRAIVILALLASEAAAGPPMRPMSERHFDHAAHQAALGGKDVACARCHPTTGTAGQLTDAGTSAVVDHGLCQGSGCHGDSFAKDTRCASIQAAKLDRVCGTCHIKDTCFPAPPAVVDRFPAGFTHGRHAPLGDAIEGDCALCHVAQAGAAAATDGHRACSACHERGAKPAMTECASCHTGSASPPAAASPSGVRFDHGSHATASKQRACLACHGTPARAEPDAELSPRMLGCQASCHDGKRAFSTTGTTCTRCHQGGEPAQPVALAQPFSHASHAALHVAIADCSSCHSLSGDGTLQPPLAGKDHQPCAQSGCHQTEFASKKPAICGVCHDAVSPSQKAIARSSATSAKVEWFTSIDHAAHLKAASAGSGNAACEQCHPGSAAASARGHLACAPCHGKGQAPAMTACAACHATSAPARAAVSRWSVAATFSHANHAEDPRKHAATACVECHANVPAATDLAAIRAPAMPTCDGCHDGKTAFKSTGFECARCHARRDVRVGMLP
jgi:hypothetical protein